MKIALIVDRTTDLYSLLGVYRPLAYGQQIGVLPDVTLDFCSAVPVEVGSGALRLRPDKTGEPLAGYDAAVIAGDEGNAPVDELSAWLRTGANVPVWVVIGGAGDILRAADVDQAIPPDRVLTVKSSTEALDVGLALCARIGGAEAALRIAEDLGEEERWLAQAPRVRRSAQVSRVTQETQIQVSLDLDGTGKYAIQTGVGFLDHMLAQLALHGLFDLELRAQGDLEIDPHHTVEDVALALGEAFRQALGDRKGIVRTASASVPMDETLVAVTVDFSGRPYAVVRIPWHNPEVGGIPTRLFTHFCEAFASQARCNLHARLEWGEDDHHQAEALFKALGRAMDAASRIDPRRQAQIPSTKGTLA